MRIVLATLCLILAGQAWAAKYKDDFNRADTEWVAAGGMMNAASKPYTYIISRGMFRIHEGLMVTDPEADQEKELIVEHLPVPIQEKGKFEASVDFLIPKPADDLAVGIVFNYKLEEPPPGARSFFAVRLRVEGALQYLQYLQHDVSSLESRRIETVARDLNVRNGKWYTLTVRIKAYPTLECTLKEAGSQGPELAFALIDLTGTRGTDGVLGIHATGHGQIQFDNLSFSTD